MRYWNLNRTSFTFLLFLFQPVRTEEEKTRCLFINGKLTKFHISLLQKRINFHCSEMCWLSRRLPRSGLYLSSRVLIQRRLYEILSIANWDNKGFFVSRSNFFALFAQFDTTAILRWRIVCKAWISTSLRRICSK